MYSRYCQPVCPPVTIKSTLHAPQVTYLLACSVKHFHGTSPSCRDRRRSAKSWVEPENEQPECTIKQLVFKIHVHEDTMGAMLIVMKVS